MRTILTIAIVSTMFLSCKQENPAEHAAKEPKAQTEIPAEKTQDYDLEIYDFSGLEAFLNKKDEKTYVINFWATWCAPCIKELPYFEQVNKTYKEKNVEVLLVSLDFPKQYEKKLIPFIKQRNIESKVIALDDPKMNDWIPKVDEDWTGAIPATIIYNKEKSRFYERSFTMEELEAELNQFINP